MYPSCLSQTNLLEQGSLQVDDVAACSCVQGKGQVIKTRLAEETVSLQFEGLYH